MPVHDWQPVDVNVFHHFHQMWTMHICDALNDGLLPPGYSALIDQRSPTVAPDVLALERRAAAKREDEPARGTVVAATPPKTRHVIQGKKTLLAERANRISIHHPLGEVICVMEILSPGNKSSRLALNKFVEKSVAFLEKGVHLLVVDLFPPTRRDPQGIHKAIWDEIDDEAPFELPSDQPLTLAAYVAGDSLADIPPTAYVQPIGVGEATPDMAPYLDLDHYVPVPLEATYMTTWGKCPKDFRAFVEAGGRSPT
jgi:Protein of unknown function (DUF4058)